MVNAPHVEIATNILNKELHYLMDTCFPVRRVVMSSHDPPWITPLVKYLLRKKKRAADRAAVYKLIGKNGGRNGAEGSLHWWRRVDKITLRE